MNDKKNHPSVIGRFQIEEVLGKGAQGVVYLARDTRLERKVALKTLHRKSQGDFSRTILVQEARTVSKLQHPNIVTLHDAGEYQGAPYLVFHYIKGKNLDQFLKEAGHLKIHQALKLILKVLEAVAYAHDNDVIHHDLKPSNILIDEKGTPHITDFGISAILGTKVDSTQEIWGTPQYMAPEAFSNKPLGSWSDVFSLGMILYEMVTGRPPYEAEDTYSLMHQIANQPIIPPTRYNKLIDAALEEIINRALAKNPKHRYPNAKVFKEALQTYLGEQQEEQGEEPVQSKQSTLEFLLRRMRHKEDFPSITNTLTEINKLSSSEASADRLANIILRDFSLTTKLLRMVNSSYYGQYGGRISTISRAVVILGFEYVRNAAMGLVLFDHLRSGPNAEELRDIAITSLISGMLAKQFGSDNRSVDSEEAFVCAMFHQLGKALVIYYFPEEYELIKAVEVKKGIDGESACAEVLGISYEEVGVGIGKHWQFPTMITKTMERIPEDQTLGGGHEDILHSLACFSNEICRLITVSGSSDETENQVEYMAKRYKGALSSSNPMRIKKVMETTMDQLDEQADLFNVDANNSQVVSKLNRWTNPSMEEPEPTAKFTATERAEISVKSEDRHAILINGIQDVTNAIIEERALNDILIMVMEIMYRGFNFDRVLLCIVNPKQKQVSGRFGFGKNVDDIIPQFRLDTDDESLFTPAIKESKTVVEEDLRSKIEQIPTWYRELINANSMVVYPIVINKRVMGLLYGDRESSSLELEVSDLNSLKTLANQAVLAIKQSG